MRKIEQAKTFHEYIQIADERLAQKKAFSSKHRTRKRRPRRKRSLCIP